MKTKSLVPAAAVGALLQGLTSLVLDDDRVRASCDLADDLDDPARMLPDKVWPAMWAAARQQRPVPELAFEVGLSMPFGAFGMFDYLVGTSATCRAALGSLTKHFRLVAFGFELSVEGSRDTPRIVVLDRGGATVDDDELTLGVIIARLRALCAPPL